MVSQLSRPRSDHLRPMRLTRLQIWLKWLSIALIVSFELGILKSERRSSVISPNGFLLSFGFPNYKKEESVLFFKNLKKEKTEKKTGKTA
jgi:hypothetical protein